MARQPTAAELDALEEFYVQAAIRASLDGASPATGPAAAKIDALEAFEIEAAVLASMKSTSKRGFRLDSFKTPLNRSTEEAQLKEAIANSRVTFKEDEAFRTLPRVENDPLIAPLTETAEALELADAMQRSLKTAHVENMAREDADLPRAIELSQGMSDRPPSLTPSRNASVHSVASSSSSASSFPPPPPPLSRRASTASSLPPSPMPLSRPASVWSMRSSTSTSTARTSLNEPERPMSPLKED